jgi:hypothetical protein
MASILGNYVTTGNAQMWMRINSDWAPTSEAMVRHADSNGSGSVDSVELADAANAGRLTIDGMHHVAFADGETADPKSPLTLEGAAYAKTMKTHASVEKVFTGMVVGGVAVAVAGAFARKPSMMLGGLTTSLAGFTFSLLHQ